MKHNTWALAGLLLAAGFPVMSAASVPEARTNPVPVIHGFAVVELADGELVAVETSLLVLPASNCDCSHSNLTQVAAKSDLLEPDFLIPELVPPVEAEVIAASNTTVPRSADAVQQSLWFQSSRGKDGQTVSDQKLADAKIATANGGFAHRAPIVAIVV